MEKRKPHNTNMQKELDILQSRLSALEVSSSDQYDKYMISVLKVLVENQKHLIEEFEHLKKAIDLLTLQIFKVEKSHSHNP
jgi:outer membrane lipopolysaccharide assembly protein LptE/RlpB